MISRRSILLSLMGLTACVAADGAPSIPADAAGQYRLDYSGVYGVGRVDLLLQGGKVSGLNPVAGAVSYRGFYRRDADGRWVWLDLVAHLPPVKQQLAGTAIIGTARDITVGFALPADLPPKGRWPVRLETQMGPVRGTVTRLE
jgi:hypothetical protein